MNHRYRFLIVFFILAAYSAIFAAGITFTFENGTITGTTPKYYEFDVYVAASASGTKIGDTQTYINYNTNAFGSSLQGSGKVTVTKGSLVNTVRYDNPIVTDNESSKLSIQLGFNSTLEDDAEDLPASATQLMHVKIEIADQAYGAGLSFDSGLMSNEQFIWDNSTNYSPVTATDTDDASLPVEMTHIQCTSSKEEGIVLYWQTASELNTVGFHIWRSVNDENNYKRITDAIIDGYGNSSSARDYSYNDKMIHEGVTYFYKIEEVASDGTRTFWGPLVAQGVNTFPDKFALKPNYPNPFNPDTHFEYHVAKSGFISINVYDLQGRLVRKLVNEEKSAGYYETSWDGNNMLNQRAASGIYILRMDTDSFHMTRKMTLIR